MRTCSLHVAGAPLTLLIHGFWCGNLMPDCTADSSQCVIKALPRLGGTVSKSKLSMCAVLTQLCVACCSCTPPYAMHGVDVWEPHLKRRGGAAPTLPGGGARALPGTPLSPALQACSRRAAVSAGCCARAQISICMGRIAWGFGSNEGPQQSLRCLIFCGFRSWLSFFFVALSKPWGQRPTTST